MNKHAAGVVLQRSVEALGLPITPRCVRFALDGVDAVLLAKVVELPLKFCTAVAYQGLRLADLLYVNSKHVQCVRLVDDWVGKAMSSEAVECHKHILE